MELETATKQETEAKQAAELAKRWLAEIDEAKRLEKDYRKEAKGCVKLFEAETRKTNQYNVLYSNTETLLPALYNSAPIPAVSRRFKDEDVLGGFAADTCRRTLEFLLDPNSPDSGSFHSAMREAVLSALVPGRGVLRFKYEAELAQIPETPEEEASETLEWEYVQTELVPWDRFLHGYGRTWSDVPWVGFIHFMSRSEVEKNFGAELAARLTYTDEAGEEEEGRSYTEGEAGKKKVACVYEVWDKESLQVLFLSDSLKEGPLKVVEDPLGLVKFFPTPQPLTFVHKLSSLVPVPMYAFYEEQAKELNKITVRINRIIEAMKVRGFYDSTMEELGKLMEADDNTLLPLANAAAYTMNNQGLDKVILLLPIEKLVAVLQQLYTQREQIKTVIYEITGVADIMRGSTAASETLGAQELKTKWGNLRLTVNQETVAEYVRDCLRIMAEIAMTKFSPQTVKAMTGTPLPLQEELDQLQIQVQQEGVEPPPEVMELLQGPTLEQVLALLQNDIQRSYKIDIETNSTTALNSQEEKQNVNELLNAMGQFFNSVAPLVQAGLMTMEIAAMMLKAITRRYSFGNEIEGMLKKLGQQQPPQQGEQEAQAKQAEQQAAQMAQQLEMQKMQQEMEFSAQEHQQKLAEMQQKGELAAAKHQMDMQKLALQASMPKKSGD